MASEEATKMEVVENDELGYDPAPVQTEILKRETIPFRPIQATYDTTIQFDVDNQRYGKYIDPANITLEVEVGIKKRSDDSKLDKAKKVAPINIPLHSMFKNVTTTLNGTVINESNGTYPYAAYIQTTMSKEREFLATQGELMLWEKDDEDSLDSATATKVQYEVDQVVDQQKITTEAVDSNALGRRQGRWFDNADSTDQSYHTVTLIGRPIGPLFQQERYLPYGVNMVLQFDRADNNFVLMNGEADEYHLKIEKIQLFVDYVTINTQVFQSDLSRKSNIVIPVTRPVVKTFTMYTGCNGETFTLFSGKLPKRLVLGYVTNSAFHGKKDENPFNFQSFNIKKLYVTRNGENYPFRPFEPNFATKQYKREYMSIFEALGILNENSSVPISYDEFGNGFAFFCFDFTGEGKNGMVDENTKHLLDQGIMTVENSFEKPLESSVNLVAYAEFETDITIDPKGNVDKGF